MTDLSKLRVALVHDLLASYGGSEQVIFQLHKIFPKAPIFTSVYDPSRLPARFRELDVRPSFLQRIPFSRRYYEAIVPLMPFAFESFDLRGFDLILSSSHACAKGVTAPPSVKHVCYCHTPMRYAWTHEEEYLAKAPLRPFVVPLAKAILAWLRRWDFAVSQKVDKYIANSQNVRMRIERFYGRTAEVVYPPVEVDRFPESVTKISPTAPYLVVSRLIPYKRVEVAVEACTKLGLPLTVIGRGPELSRAQRVAGATVTFEGEVSDQDLSTAYQQSRALIFTADEDFGIVPLEAMASGRPVLALNAGGAKESVLAGVTGAFYEDSGVEALIEALRTFNAADYNPAACRERAIAFSPEQFRERIQSLLVSFLDGSRPQQQGQPTCSDRDHRQHDDYH